MKNKLTLACLATLTLLAVCGFSLSKAKTKTQDVKPTKIGIRNHVYKAPLEVVGVKMNGLSIEPGTDFQANDDWIKALAITVKNSSNRDLLGVGAAVEFPYDKKDMPILPEINFIKGYDPMIPGSAPSDFVLRPGDTVELTLTANWPSQVDIAKDMNARAAMKVLHRGIIKPALAVFSSSELWEDGFYRHSSDGIRWESDKEKLIGVWRDTERYYAEHPKMMKASFQGGGRRCFCSSDSLKQQSRISDIASRPAS